MRRTRWVAAAALAAEVLCWCSGCLGGRGQGLRVKAC